MNYYYLCEGDVVACAETTTGVVVRVFAVADNDRGTCRSVQTTPEKRGKKRKRKSRDNARVLSAEAIAAAAVVVGRLAADVCVVRDARRYNTRRRSARCTTGATVAAAGVISCIAGILLYGAASSWHV